MILYALFTNYEDGVHPATGNKEIKAMSETDRIKSYYPLFMHVNLMVFVGYGFLSAFLKTHSWTSVAYNLLIGAYALQITILLQGPFHQIFSSPEVGSTAGGSTQAGGFQKISLSVDSLILGDFGAAAVLVSFGAIVGKVSVFQLWIIATFEVILYSLNEALCTNILKTVDMGGAMYVHVFGAYFGLATSFFFRPGKAIKDLDGRGQGGYNSTMIALLGSVFLFVYWPSFNGALAPPSQQLRIFINTIMAICASCITACGICRLFHQRLTSKVIMNATLAGGVAIGSASCIVATSSVSMCLGGAAGIIAALGELSLKKILEERINLHDTCGVHNLHGMPGILGGFAGGLAASLST